MKLSIFTGLLALLSMLPPALHAAMVITPSAGYVLIWDGNDGDNFSAAEVAVVPANLATAPGVLGRCLQVNWGWAST